MKRAYWLAFFIVWAISLSYMAAHLKRGWFPSDEGTLGLSAERTLNGELSGRDFDDSLGGLTLVHSLAFRELGINSASMRIVLFAFFVPWVAAIFYIVSRLSSPSSAGVVTLLAVAWSVPNYPAPMHSWYNLFFATFGAAALFRYLEARTRRWLYVAGICGGLSILAKITGAYYIAGALLFFVFREQIITSEKNSESSSRARFYSATIALALAVFLALLCSVIHKLPGVRGLIYFVLPAFCLVVLLLARELVGIAGHNRERFAALLCMCVPFVVGVAIPLILFLIPYLLSGSVHDLVHGIIAGPSTVIRSVAYPPESPITMIEITPFILPVMIAWDCHRVGRAIWCIVLTLFACALLVFSARSPLIYSFGWRSLSTAIPALVLTGVVMLWVSRRQERISLVRQQQIMLIMCVVALCSVVQFPFSVPLYFCYVAPLVIVFATALFSSRANPPRFVLGTIIMFYLLFAVLRITPGFIGNMGLRYAPGQPDRPTDCSSSGWPPCGTRRCPSLR